ncbi:MFS transporter [Trueperella pyogenes]|uniref:MFS transporter n=1 Tax=Trueperella pyogenes TaxID=1661 RepID=UPI00325217D4
MLTHRPLLRLWCASAASGLATWALPFVLGLAVIEALISPKELGLLLAARTVGFLVGVIYGGAASDRYGHRLLVFASSILAACSGVALTLTLGNWPLASIVIITVMGLGQGACRPAFQALIPLVVAHDERQQANAYMTIAVRVTTLLGPVATSGLALLMDTRWLVLIISVAWLVCALLPTWVESPKNAEKQSYFTQIKDGLGEALRHRWFVAGLAALVPILGLGYAATSVVLPVVSDEVYGGGEALTAAMTSYTVGALIGAFAMSKVSFTHEGWASLAGLCLISLAPLVLALTPDLWILVLTYALVGVGIELFNVPWFTATQREVAPEKFGRVSSVDFLVSYGLSPIGLALYPLAIEAFGRNNVLYFAAIICFVAPILAMLVPGARNFSDPRNAPAS